MASDNSKLELKGSYNDSMRSSINLGLEECEGSDCATKEEKRKFFNSSLLMLITAKNFIDMQVVKPEDETLESMTNFLFQGHIELERTQEKNFFVDEIRTELQDQVFNFM